MIEMWMDTARNNGLILVAPDARGKTWVTNSISKTLLNDMLSSVSEDAGVTTGNIFLFGHSDGAKLAAHLANRTIGPWQAVALHGGYNPADTYGPNADAIPIRLYLGTRDHIFSVTEASKAITALAHSGYRAELHLIPAHSHWFYEIGPKIARDSWQWMQMQTPDS